MTDISASELSEIYKFAIQLGKDAGQILLDGLDRRRSGISLVEDPVEKLNAVDIVTQTDNGASLLVSALPITLQVTNATTLPQTSKHSSTPP